jgi:hypothetical protein
MEQLVLNGVNCHQYDKVNRWFIFLAFNSILSKYITGW